MVGFESRSATNPSFASAPSDGDRADEQREHRGQRDRARRIAVGADEREDRGGDHRPERRVRAEHEDPRRAEDRVAEQAQDRRVEAGDRRQPGELGVRHPLRDEQRRQDEPGDDVVRKPADPVGAEHPQTPARSRTFRRGSGGLVQHAHGTVSCRMRPGRASPRPGDRRLSVGQMRIHSVGVRPGQPACSTLAGEPSLVVVRTDSGVAP